MISIKAIGRRGNNLFQYAFGRILAEKLGYAMEIAESPYQLEVKEFKNAALLNGRRIPELVTVGDEYTLDQLVDLATTKDSGILLNGFWQKQHYYWDRRSEIKEWFRIESSHRYSLTPDDWVIHIRHEDYLESKLQLSPRYYDRCLEYRKDLSRVFVVGKDLSKEVRDDYRRRHGAIVVDTGSDLADFTLLRDANNIVVANSSFSWWAAFLSQAERVFAPLPTHGYWSPGQDQRLQIPGFHTIVEDDNTPR